LLQKLIELSERYNFVIASDECYSEIYFNEENPPIGLLEAASQMGRDFKNLVVFHSLSKRSSVPGMRSGFVAGDADILAQYLQYRTYHGSAMPYHHQYASIKAWSDETHVQKFPHEYREKINYFLENISQSITAPRPDGTFYIWAKTPIDDIVFAKQLYQQENITVLPGQFLARTVNGINPATNYVRMALVAPLVECKEAVERINHFVSQI
jgi:N-succinyldiaminopimelate aminotransferase